jgi:predicted transcriptional regulator of viral defense system
MLYQEFRKSFYDLGCISSSQIYTWHPGFDKNNLGRWVNQGLLIKLRNNHYCFPEFKNHAGFEMYVANRIYRPSYISLHSALAFYGLIPEAPVQVISVTTLKTASFSNSMGSYHYHSIKPAIMFGYVLKAIQNKYYVQIAEPEKALLDMFYIYPFYDTPQEIEALRLDDILIGEMLNKDKLKEYASRFTNHALNHRIEVLTESYSL